MSKAPSALKSYLDASKRPSRLLGPVERWMLTRPPDTSRRTDVFHPSEMVREDWCHRASWLAVVGGESPRPERHNLRTNNIFDEGHFIHAKWQRRLAEMGNLYGLWQYPNGQREWGTSLSEDYREVPLRDEALRIAGHCDGWVVGLGDDFIIEIKSVGTGTLRSEAPHLIQKSGGDADKAWDQIRAPFTTHFLQGQMYLHLLHLMDKDGLLERRPPSECVFLYEWKANQDVKEFVVRHSPDYLEDILQTCARILAMDGPPPCSVSPEKGGCRKCSAFGDEG